ncbi:class I SAM-dependent RNA methyltransferase [Irregularibacter muris]|uniref:Class I SAM-dependent RNA methyltransferase n=1 Tax=Irregularibacter muris TaxID=1796619 RepID=A0AAE3HEF8_9FIRM|nr:class I SAM-dependent RNA methyltransferase [Irregularibacter muris]MCR1898975.1 class I SAM-dependent RNA methyltransferase [Irregularibacter muris]
MSKIELVATSTFGLESIVAQEIKDLGYEDVQIENGRVTFVADEAAIPKANYWLRTADRVFVKMGEFKALSFEELFEKTKSLPWEDWIPEDGKFPIYKAKSVKSKLFSLSDCQSIVKKAVVEKLKEKHKIQWFEESGAEYPIQVAILKDVVTLLIDTSGEGLHKRGYRAHGNEAPIKETLAAALILLSRWKPSRELADPLCGSGTILIEAAMIGRNIAPGLQRHFVSESWNRVPKELWKQAKVEAMKAIDVDSDFRLLGSDIDPKALRQARQNAEMAGVDDCVYFQKLSVEEFKSRKKYGVIITNPPYGERLGEKKEVEDLYRMMGKAFRDLDSWSYFIITAHQDFEKLFGKKSDKNRKLYNGRLLTYLYQYFGPLPPRREKENYNL